MKKEYTHIGELLEEGVSMTTVIDEALSALSIGEYTSEFISKLVYFAIDHDLEASHVPLAVLKDAFCELTDRCSKRSE